MKDLALNFGERVKFLAKQKGVAPAIMLREIGINHSAVTSWAKKNQFPNGESIIKIARYFGVSTDYLLGVETTPALKLNAEEKELIRFYGDMSAEGREILITTARGLAVSYKKDATGKLKKEDGAIKLKKEA